MHNPTPSALRPIALLTACALILGALLMGGCRTEGEVFVAEATLVGDATEGYGPYEVVARLNGRRAIKNVTLNWAVEGQEPVSVAMASGPDLSYSGTIEAPTTLAENGAEERVPFALGTRVSWWIEVVSEGAIDRAPVEAPNETFFFIVGPARQTTRVVEVSPDSGPSIGGTTVFVRGSGFRAGSEVIFAGSLAPEVKVVSAHLLEVVTPPAPAGLAEIIVRSPSGSIGRLPDAFFFIAPPQPEAITPDSGPTSGGTRVRIVGTGFDQAAEVRFGEQDAIDVQVIDPTEIFATAPAADPGFVDVSVTNPDTQVGVLDLAYEYIPPPIIDGIDPEVGPIEGGDRVTVTGQGFQNGLRLLFDGLDAQIVDVADGQITALTPAHPAGRVDVTVINPDTQRDTAPLIYAYLAPPEIFDVIPGEGSTLGGTEVRLVGSGFFEGMEATFGGVRCTDVIVESAAQATCVTPANPEGLVDVTITNIDGQSATLPDGFEYVPPPPEIIDIDPDRGSDLGGTTITIEVRFGQTGMTVLFDDRPGQVFQVTIEGDTAFVTVITPSHPEGFSDVRVINPDGLEDTEQDGFFFVGPPVIETVDPPEGPDTGGQIVTITGRNFLEGMTVFFDGIEAEVIEIDAESGVVRVRTPPHPEGIVDVSVTNPDGRSDTAEEIYEYVLLPPEITGIDPDRGPVWGGTAVSITGSSFREGLQVLVNGVLVPANRIDGGLIELIMPPGPVGPATIEVINPDNQSDSGTFTYVEPELSPEGGLTAGFTTTTIRGAGFDPGTSVTFNGVPAESVVFVSEDELTVISPPGTVGAATLGFTTGGGRSGSFGDKFEYRIFVDDTDAVGLPIESGCLETEAGDLDGDGDDDIAVANGGLFQDNSALVPNAIYFNNGVGGFDRTELNFNENSMNVEFADIDGDNDLDMIMINLGDLGSLNRLYLNDGNGNMTEVSNRFPIQRASYDGGFTDVNNDGLPDIILVNTAERENLFINTGGGFFTDRTNLLPSGDSSEHDHDYDAGDLNGDGVPDFALSVDNSIENDLSVRYVAENRIFFSNGPNGGWTLSTDTLFTPLNGDFLETRIGDVNGDGLPDIVTIDNIDRSAPIVNPLTAEPRTGVLVYINDGASDFTLDLSAVPDFIGPGVSHDLIDLDDDGDLDIVAGVSTNIGDLRPVGTIGQPNWLLINRGDGTFVDGTGSWPANRDATWDFAAIDLDNDGLKDLFVCNYLTPNRMLRQTASPAP